MSAGVNVLGLACDCCCCYLAFLLVLSRCKFYFLVSPYSALSSDVYQLFALYKHITFIILLPKLTERKDLES